MNKCARCHKPIGKLERTQLICELAGYVCDDCFEAHLEQCDKCRIWHEEDQAQLAADQLGKRGKFPLPYATADDDAARLLEDRSYRTYAKWDEVGM